MRVPPARQSPNTSRTSACQRPSCRQCGGPIRGRRRNGFCSDRCRLRVRRAAVRARRQELVETMKQTLAAVEEELLS